MPGHIGIVACSAEGAALCYRTICAEGPSVMGKYGHPEVTMHTHPLGDYDIAYREGDWDRVAGLMLSSTAALARAGADFVICPDNTIHQAYEAVAERAPLPWLHIAEVVAAEAERRGFKRLGILGTWFLVNGPVYPSRLSPRGIEHVIPEEGDSRFVDEIIFEELVHGIFKEESREHFGEVIDRLRDRGCDSVVLGCTEIPLLVTEESSSLPILDSTRLLARAALDHAIQMGEEPRLPRSST